MKPLDKLNTSANAARNFFNDLVIGIRRTEDVSVMTRALMYSTESAAPAAVAGAAEAVAAITCVCELAGAAAAVAAEASAAPLCFFSNISKKMRGLLRNHVGMFVSMDLPVMLQISCTNSSRYASDPLRGVNSREVVYFFGSNTKSTSRRKRKRRRRRRRRRRSRSRSRRSSNEKRKGRDPLHSYLQLRGVCV